MDPEEVQRARQKQRQDAWEALSDVEVALFDLRLSLRSDSDWRDTKAAEVILRIAEDVKNHMEGWENSR